MTDVYFLELCQFYLQINIKVSDNHFLLSVNRVILIACLPLKCSELICFHQRCKLAGSNY